MVEVAMMKYQWSDEVSYKTFQSQVRCLTQILIDQQKIQI